MINPTEVINSQIYKAVNEAYKKAVENNELLSAETGSFVIEIPKENGFGDFSTNFAMQNAKAFCLPPRKIAEIILKYIDFTDTFISKAEVAGPGFINFFINTSFYSFALNVIFNEKNSFGKTAAKSRKKIMVEFVSANPTGPMHMGNARGGAMGDCLAEILSWSGHDVTREFYINDAGNQIEKFYQSINARYNQLFKGEDFPFPEDGYRGDDIIELAKEIADIHGDKLINADEDEKRKVFISYGLEKNINKIKNDLSEYRINYDVWFYESTLHGSSEISDTIEILKRNGYTYELDGALWYKATRFGAEKDDVLIRANGIPTYFAADIAYHRNKFCKRGFDKVINIWGADHHGHVARLKGAMTAVGIDESRLDIILMQLVRLVSEGKPVKMSKRTGKSITLRDLLSETSVDAARFFFNLRAADSHFDFDLDLAVSESSQNPVYYVQYAYARISSILRVLQSENISLTKTENIDFTVLEATEEKDLVKALSRLPQEIVNAAKDYDPSMITRYVTEIASLFHKFYNACRVKCEDENLLYARLLICECTRIVLKNSLDLLKITAPEKM